MAWREGFFRTFLERDIPQLGITIPAETLRRFWMMVAHYHGQVWNAAEFARSLGTSEVTARRYLDILAGAYMVRVLPPWFENVSKRQVKSPKVYIRDSGVLHGLLQLGTLPELQSHPKLGASWEGFAVEQIIRLLDTRDAYFWATHGGAELDLMVLAGGKRYGFEIKYADVPGTSRSMQVALHDLALEHLWVVYPGQQEYALADRITALPLDALTSREVTPALTPLTRAGVSSVSPGPLPEGVALAVTSPVTPSADQSARRRGAHVAAGRSPERAVQLLPARDRLHVGGDALKRTADAEDTESTSLSASPCLRVPVSPRPRYPFR